MRLPVQARPEPRFHLRYEASRSFSGTSSNQTPREHFQPLAQAFFGMFQLIPAVEGPQRFDFEAMLFEQRLQYSAALGKYHGFRGA